MTVLNLETLEAHAGVIEQLAQTQHRQFGNIALEDCRVHVYDLIVRPKINHPEVRLALDQRYLAPSLVAYEGAEI